VNLGRNPKVMVPGATMAEQVASLSDLPESEEKMLRALTFATLTADKGSDPWQKACERISAESGRPIQDVARDLSVALARLKAWEDFTRSHQLKDYEEETDRAVIYELAAAALEKQRQKLTNALSQPRLSPERKKALEKEVERLEAIENRAWGELHRPYVGPVWYDTPTDPTIITCRYCDTQLSSTHAYHRGRVCSVCARTFQLMGQQAPNPEEL
jgi:hypothetical protein